MSNSTVTPPASSRFDQLCRSLIAEPKVWLVTGVAGFIGSSLLEALLGLGQTVVGLDNFSTGFQANIDDVLAMNPGAASRFRMIRGDIRDAESCRAACEGVQFVLHQAALASVPRSIDDPATSNQVNVDGTLNMFMAARTAGVDRLVYATSCAVYGDAPDEAISEDWPLRPLSPYAASKASNEMYAAGFQRSYEAPITGLRYFNVYGRRQDPTGAYAGVIPSWVKPRFSSAPPAAFSAMAKRAATLCMSRMLSKPIFWRPRHPATWLSAMYTTWRAANRPPSPRFSKWYGMRCRTLSLRLPAPTRRTSHFGPGTSRSRRRTYRRHAASSAMILCIDSAAGWGKRSIGTFAHPDHPGS